MISDEIYCGAELNAVLTPTVWGRYERVSVVTSGCRRPTGFLAAASGGPCPPSLAQTLWGVHDYTTIAPGALSDVLARMALSRRSRAPARSNARHRSQQLCACATGRTPGTVLSSMCRRRLAIVFVRYHHDINSTVLVERLRGEQERPRGARRSFRDGSPSEDRLRFPPRVAGRRVDTHRGVDGFDRRACALTWR